MNENPVGVESVKKSRFGDDIYYSESDKNLFPDFDGDPIEYYDPSSWRLPEELNTVKRRTRPAWQLIEDYKEEMRLKRELEDIDSDPLFAD